MSNLVNQQSLQLPPDLSSLVNCMIWLEGYDNLRHRGIDLSRCVPFMCLDHPVIVRAVKPNGILTICFISTLGNRTVDEKFQNDENAKQCQVAVAPAQSYRGGPVLEFDNYTMDKVQYLSITHWDVPAAAFRLERGGLQKLTRDSVNALNAYIMHRTHLLAPKWSGPKPQPRPGPGGGQGPAGGQGSTGGEGYGGGQGSAGGQGYAGGQA